MEITEIRLRKMNTENKMKGIASITFDESFVVNGVRIIESEDKLFVAMPSKKSSNGTFNDIAHPIHSEMREKIEKSVLDEYFSTLAIESQ